MKILLTALLVLTIQISFSQNLKNTEWHRIFVQRKDESMLSDIDTQNLLQDIKFEDTTAFISLDHIFVQEQPFKFKNEILYIGRFLKFNIDTINQIVLKLTDISDMKKSDHLLKTYSFINSRYLFQYLKEKNQIKFINDTLIQGNVEFSPIYANADLRNLLRDPFRHDGDSGIISGYFILNHNMEISEVKISRTENVNVKQTKAFTKILRKTGKRWTLPITDLPYSYKIDFACYFKTRFDSKTNGVFYSSFIEFYPIIQEKRIKTAKPFSIYL